jgi:hypothetical protein
MTDLLQIAAFFLGASGRLGVRSAARPGNTPGFQQEGYRFPDHHGQVFTSPPSVVYQAIENERFYNDFGKRKSEFSAMLMLQVRPAGKNHA